MLSGLLKSDSSSWSVGFGCVARQKASRACKHIFRVLLVELGLAVNNNLLCRKKHCGNVLDLSKSMSEPNRQTGCCTHVANNGNVEFLMLGIIQKLDRSTQLLQNWAQSQLVTCKLS